MLLASVENQTQSVMTSTLTLMLSLLELILCIDLLKLLEVISLSAVTTISYGKDWPSSSVMLSFLEKENIKSLISFVLSDLRKIISLILVTVFMEQMQIWSCLAWVLTKHTSSSFVKYSWTLTTKIATSANKEVTSQMSALQITLKIRLDSKMLWSSNLLKLQ